VLSTLPPVVTEAVYVIEPPRIMVASIALRLTEQLGGIVGVAVGRGVGEAVEGQQLKR
jgi:hypothetical protein